MKQIIFFSYVLIMMLGVLSCDAQDSKNKNLQKTVSAKIEVYYFHFTRRCSTCMSVEENAKKSIEALYPDKVKAGEYIFKSVNLDDTSSKVLAEKYGIGGQTLLVICGNKKIDITDKGFMNAHNLEKMKEEIKKAIESALKG